MIIEHISTELMIVDPLTKSMLVMKFKDRVEIQFMKLICIQLFLIFMCTLIHLRKYISFGL